MFKKYPKFILAILVLITFYSCGFIRLDLNEGAEEIIDFSPNEPTEITEVCECYGPQYANDCNYNGAPVCGCDGITYANACFALKNGIYIYRRGECGKRIIRPRPLPCPVVKPAPIVNPITTSSPEVKQWPANPRTPAINKSPERGNVTLLPTHRHKRK